MATTATTVSQLTPPSGQSPQNTDEISLRRNLQAAMTHTKLDDNFHNLTTRVNDLATQFNTLLGDLADIATTGSYDDIATGQPPSYSLPIAQNNAVGGVRVPDVGNIDINADGDISVDFSNADATDLGLTVGGGLEIVDGVLQKKEWTWLNAAYDLKQADGSTYGHNHFIQSFTRYDHTGWEQIQIAGLSLSNTYVTGGTTIPDDVSEVVLHWHSNEISLWALTPFVQLICHSADNFDASWNFKLPVTDIPTPWFYGEYNLSPNHHSPNATATENPVGGNTPVAGGDGTMPGGMTTGKIIVHFHCHDAPGTRGPLKLLAYR